MLHCIQVDDVRSPIADVLSLKTGTGRISTSDLLIGHHLLRLYWMISWVRICIVDGAVVRMILCKSRKSLVSLMRSVVMTRAVLPLLDE